METLVNRLMSRYGTIHLFVSYQCIHWQDHYVLSVYNIHKPLLEFGNDNGEPQSKLKP